MLKSIYFLPHGMQILPGVEDPYNEGFRSLDQSMKAVGENFDKQKNDIIILITPHAHSISENYLIYGHNLYQSLYYKIDEKESVVFGEIYDQKIWKGNVEISSSLGKYMDNKGINADLLTQGSPDYPISLAWGETIPLSYLIDESSPEVIIIGLPRKRLRDGYSPA